MRSANLLLVQYLVHSAAYYHLSESLASDAKFDADAKELAKRWKEVTHWHKSLVEIESLRVNTSAYYVRFPQRIINAAKLRVEKMNAAKEKDRQRRKKQ